jgi:hypothetical protein
VPGEEVQRSLKYVADSELNLDEGHDLLATRPYVDVLERTVLDCTPPFTIGLFGSWGSGKSSVAATLCRRLEASGGETGVTTFVYDAWKYSGDAFYRAFLLQFRSRFNLVGDVLLEEFYKDKTADVGHKVVAADSFWLTLVSWSPLLLLLVWLTSAQTDIAVVVTLLGVITTVLAQVVKNAFIVYTVTVNRPRTFAPEQFAEAFNAAVDEVLGRHVERRWFRPRLEPAERRILIVIDNIDRCDGETARDLLLNVKNFLERKDVVFLLPLDPVAVKRFLRLPEPEASEYLRKIFTASVTIKPFTTSELFDFARGLNAAYGLGLPDEAISLVCQEFATNPRRIIQFLNTLQNELALATAQERDHLLECGAVTGNVPFLAKVLVLREEWPEFFNRVCAESGLLSRVGTAILADRYVAVEGEDHLRHADGLPDLSQGLYLFLRRSQTITADGLDPFIVNRDVFGGVPDSLYELVISQSWDDIAKGIVEGAWSLRQVVGLTLRVGDIEVVQRGLMLTTGFNLLGTLGAMLSDALYQAEAETLIGDAETHKIAAMCELDSVDRVLDKLVPERLVALSRFLLDRGHPGLCRRAVAHVKSAFLEEGADAPAT